MNLQFFDEFTIVDGFHVQPGFFRFRLDGINYFSSGMKCYGELKVYRLDEDGTYCVAWLITEEYPIAEVLAERDENERYSKFRKSLGLEIGFTDYCFLDDRRKEKQVFESLDSKFGLTPKECAYIAKYIVSEEISPEIKEITDPDEFAEEITLANHLSTHRWAGDSGEEEFGEVLVGDLEWGESRSLYDMHDGNGDPYDEESHRKPNFDVTRKAVVHIHSRVYDYFNGSNQDESSDRLLIYNPSCSAVSALIGTARESMDMIDSHLEQE